jgi:8-oxo-dGTP pyrophosphatase MutT (NUDIX family)
VPGDARDGAGLVLLYPVREDGDHDHPSVLLTVRRDDLPNHAGQVSLPGGERESGESLAEAALREAEEEVRLDRSGVRVLGNLSPLHIPVSGFVLHPIVAHYGSRPSLRPDEHEVARVLEVPLRSLLDPSRARMERRHLGGTDYDVPYFAVGGEKVWGATAMVLAELLWLAGYPPDPGKTRTV